MIRTITLVIVLFSVPAYAEVTVFTQSAQWQMAVPDYSTITFAELPANTWITNQYSDLGIAFTDGIDLTYQDPTIFGDGFGLNGAFDETTVEFDTPMTAIAMDFPGIARIQLYSAENLIYTSPLLGSSGTGFFGGLVSTIPFDRAELYDPLGGGFFLDNLHFGPPIPAPSALLLLGMAVIAPRRRRRCG